MKMMDKTPTRNCIHIGQSHRPGSNPKMPRG